MESVREIIKTILRHKNWDKIELARHYKVAPSQVTRWLAGVQRPRGEVYLDMFLEYQKIKNEETSRLPA